MIKELKQYFYFFCTLFRNQYFCVFPFLKIILTKLKSGKKSSFSENQCFHLAGCWNTILVPEIDKVFYFSKRFGTTCSSYYLLRDYLYLCKINISYVRNLPELRYEVKQPNWIWREALKNLKSSQNRSHSLGLLCLQGWWKRRAWLPVSSQSVQIGSNSKEQPLEYICLYLSNWIRHSWLMGLTSIIQDW